jgi:hypothetical protein
MSLVALNPKTQLTISLDRAKASNIAKQNHMTLKQLIQLIEPILSATLENTLNDMVRWILKYVPKRTGQLRESLLRSIQNSRVKNGVLQFIIGTHLNYAAKVNAMSTSQVRHSGSWYEHSGAPAYAYYGPYRHRGTKVGKRRMGVGRRYKGPSNYRVFLYDPDAIGGFWDAMLKYIEVRLLFHMKNAMQVQYGKTQLPWVIH